MKLGLAAIACFLLFFANEVGAVVSLSSLPPPAPLPTPAAAATVPSTTTTVPSAPSIVSINPAANTGQSSQNNASGLNNLIGAALVASGAAMMSNPNTVPAGIATMAMGLLALAQGAADNNAAGQSGTTADSSATTPSTTSTTASTTPNPTPTAATDSGMNAAFQTPAGQQAISAITAAGGTVTPDGVTMPDGTTQPWSAFSSGAAMNAAGMDGAGAMKTVAALERKFGLDAAGQAGSGGIGMPDTSGGGGPSKPANEFVMPKFNNPFAMNAAQKAKLAAGKTITTAGGDPIGVQMDNIFAMIHRAYDRQRTQANFIDDPRGRVGGTNMSTAFAPKGPVTMIKRMPASLDSGH